MKRILVCCLLLPLAGVAFAAAPPAVDPAPAATTGTYDQQMAALQARMNALAERMAALSTKLGDEASASALHYLADDRRGMLGIAVSPAGKGLRVDAVTPGGPAEHAGLEAGDTITAVDGKPVGTLDAAAEAELRRARPGTPIALEVSRDGKTRELRVTPERLQPGDWQATVRAAREAARQATASVDSPEFRRSIQQSIDAAMQSASAALANASVARDAAREAMARDRAWAAFASPWWGLNLAPLNPDLGRYFGTEHGVLVLSRNQRQFPDLQPGDVITRIGGKAVDGPGAVQRGLRAASNSRQVDVELRRHGKNLTLAMKVPPREDLLPPPPPPAPPSPPAPAKPVPPPAPPAPPAPPPSSAR